MPRRVMMSFLAALAGCPDGGQTTAGQAPAGQTPFGQTPSGQTPGGQTPGGQTPGGQTPGGQTPGGQTPGGQTPGGQTPGGQTPGGQTPGGQTPGGQTPGGIQGGQNGSAQGGQIGSSIQGGQTPGGLQGGQTAPGLHPAGRAGVLHPGSGGTPQGPNVPEQRDPCLVGAWTMSSGDVDALARTVVPAPGLHVVGTLHITFQAEQFVYSADPLVVRMDLPGRGNMEADAHFTTTGTYSADGTTMVLEGVAAVSEARRWTARVRGRTITVPGTVPNVSFLPSGAAPYTCSPNRLVIQTRNASGSAVPMNFAR